MAIRRVTSNPLLPGLRDPSRRMENAFDLTFKTTQAPTPAPPAPTPASTPQYTGQSVTSQPFTPVPPDTSRQIENATDLALTPGQALSPTSGSVSGPTTGQTYTGIGGKQFEINPEGYRVDNGVIAPGFRAVRENQLVSVKGGQKQKWIDPTTKQLTFDKPTPQYTGRQGGGVWVNPEGYRYDPWGNVNENWQLKRENGVLNLYESGRKTGYIDPTTGKVTDLPEGMPPQAPQAPQPGLENPYETPVTNPQIPRQATVAGQMQDLIKEGSPYVQLFEQRATEDANRLGLLNSAMKVQAGQLAALEGAYPIAAADADVAARSYLSGQEYGQNRGLISQEYGERGRLSAQEAQQREDLERVVSDEHLRRTGFTLSGNLQGKFADHIAQIQSTSRQAVQNVMTAPDMLPWVKDRMIADIEAQRDLDLQFINSVYSDLPVWQTEFTSRIGETPPGPIENVLEEAGQAEPEGQGEEDPYPFGEEGDYVGQERYTREGVRFIWNGSEWRREHQRGSPSTPVQRLPGY